MNITKSGFVQQLREEHHYTKKAAETLVDDFLNLVLANLEEGNTVSFYGFGVFDIVRRAQRTCENPQNRDEICVIKEHWVPKFYAGEPMKRAVSLWEAEDRKTNTYNTVG